MSLFLAFALTSTVLSPFALYVLDTVSMFARFVVLLMN